MKIRYLNSNRLYYAFLAGGSAVIQDQFYLNKINVFPVPDSDTGTNLASTMHSIAECAVAAPSLKATLASIADAALSGARGNSGLIFSQFIHGFSQEIKNEMRLSTRAFGESAKRAVRYAYQAMLSPVEGTMLTVIRDWADAVYEKRMATSDFSDLLSYSLQAARYSLKETPKKLSILARAGVVDAGAKGFVDFIEGIVNFITRGRLRGFAKKAIPEPVSGIEVHAPRETITHRYCTEALLVSEAIPTEKIRADVRAFGESGIVAGTEDKVRIHVHTNQPADLFSRLKDYGSIAQVKVDDMQKQYEVSYRRKANIALVTDSSCDLPPEIIDDHQIHVIPLHISFGDSLFLDKLTITPAQFYSLLKTSKIHPQSSQPSLKSIENLFSFLASHYESVIVITLSAKLSGGFNLCQQAAARITNKKITVIDSRNISSSLGLLVLRAAEAIREGKSHEEVVELATAWVGKAKLWADIQTLKYLVRGGRVSPLKGVIARILNLKPIISVDAEGKATAAGRSFSRRGNMKKILKMVRDIAAKEKVWRYAIVHAASPKRAQAYARKLSEFLDREPAYIMPVSPVVGVHNGIGALGISVLTE